MPSLSTDQVLTKVVPGAINDPSGIVISWPNFRLSPLLGVNNCCVEVGETISVVSVAVAVGKVGVLVTSKVGVELGVNAKTLVNSACTVR